jgi:hypothetical protein
MLFESDRKIGEHQTRPDEPQVLQEHAFGRCRRVGMFRYPADGVSDALVFRR